MYTPIDPLNAVTHADPYPYYSSLAAERPFYFDDGLNMWIASSAAAVSEVLGNGSCRVRPENEPVPKTLLDSKAGVIFGHLVRMTDGAGHCPLKKAASDTLEKIDPDRVARLSEQIALSIFDAGDPTAFSFRLPIFVMGDLLGIPEDLLGQAESWMSKFVRCVAPGGTAEQIEEGKAAAEKLYEMFENMPPANGSVFAELVKALADLGITSRKVAIVNSIGFLFQPYEATAGLIGNSLLALAARPEIYGQLKNEAEFSSSFIAEVARFDSPVQNTRRFVAEDTAIAGHPIRSGDVILVVVAAANRDPAANPNPNEFDIFRSDRRSFTFGAGAHSCPGENIAIAIAAAGVRAVLDSRIDLKTLRENFTYRASANTRIPIFNNVKKEQKNDRSNF